MVDVVSQLKMNWGELKRKVLLPFAPTVGEYSKTHGGTVDNAGGAVLLVVGHACSNLRVVKSPIGFPLASVGLFGSTDDWGVGRGPRHPPTSL